MPEAAIHLDDDFPRWENDVGTPRQIATVQPESVTKMMEQRPDGLFRLRIFAFDATHSPPPPFRHVRPRLALQRG
jgi:hypothetical protein